MKLSFIGTVQLAFIRQPYLRTEMKVDVLYFGLLNVARTIPTFCWLVQCAFLKVIFQGVKFWIVQYMFCPKRNLHLHVKNLCQQKVM